ncbi:MAG: hypothetical protein AAFQ80_12370 [Cyanobacteria bacterium J06621_8]
MAHRRRELIKLVISPENSTVKAFIASFFIDIAIAASYSAYFTHSV